MASQPCNTVNNAAEPKVFRGKRKTVGQKKLLKINNTDLNEKLLIGPTNTLKQNRLKRWLATEEAEQEGHESSQKESKNQCVSLR